MKKEYILLSIFLVVVLSALVLRLLPSDFYKLRTATSTNDVITPQPQDPENPQNPQEPVIPNEPVKEPEPVKPNLPEIPISTSSEVILLKPTAGEIITSPYTVEGRARGAWFFEASLPVKLLAKNGDVILLTYGQAQSDWMTPEFVPFKSVLEFTTTATSGYLVISKDNPSGLTEHDASVTYPVLFK